MKQCIAIIFLLASSAVADVVISPGYRVVEHRLVKVEFDSVVNYAGREFFSQCQVLGIVDGKFQDVDAIMIPGQQESDGTWSKSILIWTGPPGSYVVLGTEGPVQFQKKVDIVKRTDPDPNPDPDPPRPDPDKPLSKLAKLTKEKAEETGIDKDTASKIAKNFKTVAEMIGSGSITSPEQAQTKLAELNVVPQSTKPFFDWLVGYMNNIEKARKDIKFLKTMFEHIAAGLDAVD